VGQVSNLPVPGKRLDTVSDWTENSSGDCREIWALLLASVFLCFSVVRLECSWERRSTTRKTGKRNTTRLILDAMRSAYRREHKNTTEDQRNTEVRSYFDRQRLDRKLVRRLSGDLGSVVGLCVPLLLCGET
jgi:hypothetical protein